jgi:isoleucyl-tRNA synthetase
LPDFEKDTNIEAEVTMSDLEPILRDLDTDSLAETFISGVVHLVAGQDGISIKPTTNHKCGRCWRHLPEVEEDGALCRRCDEVLNG